MTSRTPLRRHLGHPRLAGGLTRLADYVPGMGSVLWRAAHTYIGGRDVAEAQACVERLLAQGCQVSLDLFGTDTDEAEIGAVTESYLELARATAGRGPAVWLSVDPSHVGLHTFPAAGRAALERIAGALTSGRRLQIGAEAAETAESTLRAVLDLAGAGLPVTATVQANLVRSHDDARRLAEAGVPVRLVKGAFREDPRISWRAPEQVDASYVHIAESLHRQGAAFSLATHDRTLREQLLSSVGPVPCEVGLGVRPRDTGALARSGAAPRVYVPYGPLWLRFYLRRLAEAPPRRLRGPARSG
ncbi:hypothetical protein [Streptomyces sp. NPDC059918]|uniref:hypothetical protein n=1 Tax=unclassified Streptomyces TaxID=2593676 RepID=UPI0036519DAE